MMSDLEDKWLKPDKRFTRVSHSYLKLPMSCQAKVLFLLLLQFYQFNKDGVHPSQTYLAKNMGLKTRKSVNKYAKELQDLGLLEWEQTKKQSGTANHYYLDTHNKVRLRNIRKSVASKQKKKAVVLSLAEIKKEMA